jgi:hypothetical protein
VKPDAPLPSGQMHMECLFYPPKRFRSGRSVISTKQVELMSKHQGEVLKTMITQYENIFVYARGSYLKSLQMAAERSDVEIKEILSAYELSVFKKKGILWMKMGLRMPKVFRVFSRRILAIVQKNYEQLTFPI